MITLDVHGSHGFKVTWPYFPDATLRYSIINKVKSTGGFSFRKPSSSWITNGPEVILDMDRLGLWQYVSTQTPAARDRVKAFRENLEAILLVKHAALTTEQYAYQAIGTQSLAVQKRGILADDMGLGKTKQALDAASLINAKRILVVAPKSLTYNWEAEVKKWHPKWKATVMGDNATERSNAMKEGTDDGRPWVLIINYEKLRLTDWDFKAPWDVVILDECQKVKNTAAQVHKAVKKLKADNLWALSGTPMEMRLEELYGVMAVVRPTVFGGWIRFREQHLITDAWGNIVGGRNMELLRERIAPWMTRRKKSDVLTQLPPKLYNDVFVDLNPAEHAEYRRIKDQFLAWLKDHDKSGNEANALTQLLRLQQFTCSPALLEENCPDRGSKFAMLEELIGEWDGKVVVFTQFSQMANRLCEWLDTAYLISGDVDAKERLVTVNEFNENPAAKVLVSTDAGAYGLNITSADLIVHYSQLWNPGKMFQREDRLHRIGQTRVVNVVNLLAKKTIDEGMQKILEERRKLFKDIVDAAEDVIMKKYFSSGSLKNMVEGK